MKTLFGDTAADAMPLAARMRPRRVEEYLGQRQLLGPDQPISEALRTGRLHSMVLWGPPGSGKTTLARMLAAAADARLETLSPMLDGVRDIRAVVERARGADARTALLVDEVHRFNKSQQDTFLPFVEDGTLTLIGATTENPSFELNNALLSRLRVYVLQSLDVDALEQILRAAVADRERGLGALGVSLSDAACAQLARGADGDARRALNGLELAVELALHEGLSSVEPALLARLADTRTRRFDKGADVFHDQISALHKAVRGSAPDAALYWLARMLDGGCDPLYIARRMLRMASEDIGNADPRALSLALDAWMVQERLGSPEGELALAQAASYLAVAPKSNAVYQAMQAAQRDVSQLPDYPVPMSLRNAPTATMRALGHGQGYRYPHDEADAYAAGARYFPDAMREGRYYHPTPRGLEARIAERMAAWRALDAAASRSESS